MQPTPIFEEQGRCLSSALTLLFAVLLLVVPFSHPPTLSRSLPAPCAAERADWRRVQNAPKIGKERPQRWWTAQARLRQCEREQRER